MHRTSRRWRTEARALLALMIVVAAGARSACVFAFTVKHVPDAETYSFQMSHRGGVVYTHEELVENNWKIGAALTPSTRAEVVAAVQA